MPRRESGRFRLRLREFFAQLAQLGEQRKRVRFEHLPIVDLAAVPGLLRFASRRTFEIVNAKAPIRVLPDIHKLTGYGKNTMIA